MQVSLALLQLCRLVMDLSRQHFFVVQVPAGITAVGFTAGWREYLEEEFPRSLGDIACLLLQCLLKGRDGNIFLCQRLICLG